MKLPMVNTPLGIIALFVALIELFLAYPVTELQGSERLILVLFMTLFPFFVASLFFFVLWHRPLHLYNPQDIPQELRDRFQAKATRATALEVAFQELQQENQHLRVRFTAPEAAVLTPAASNQMAEEVERLGRSDVDNLQAEVRALIQSAETIDESAMEEAKREIQHNRRESKRLKSQKVQSEMSKFRDWLSARGFSNPPPIPTIVIEPSTFLNAYYSVSDDTAHLGATICEDSDTIAHTYFHVVLMALDVLGRFEGETAALIEGYCDYFACSYNGDPYMGEKFAAAVVEDMGEKAASAAGISAKWIRNLRQSVTPGEAGPGPHHMSLVWSGACWELRERYGQDSVDSALRSTLYRLESDSNISQAAKVLSEELFTLKGEPAKTEVIKVFQKREIIISA